MNKVVDKEMTLRLYILLCSFDDLVTYQMSKRILQDCRHKLA